MLSQQFDIMVTTACNARCPFCVQEATFKPERCTDDRFLAGLDKHFADFYRAGGRRVVITGGEPLLLPYRVLAVLTLLAPYHDLEVKAI
jgi:molybdenum cofactor biosynthesis enzyme MoaA